MYGGEMMLHQWLCLYLGSDLLLDLGQVTKVRCICLLVKLPGVALGELRIQLVVGVFAVGAHLLARLREAVAGFLGCMRASQFTVRNWSFDTRSW